MWPPPSTRTPALKVMKFKILVDSSLVIITIYLACLNHYYIHVLSLSKTCPGVERKFLFKKYTNVTLFTPKLPALGGGGES